MEADPDAGEPGMVEFGQHGGFPAVEVVQGVPGEEWGIGRCRCTGNSGYRNTRSCLLFTSDLPSCARRRAVKANVRVHSRGSASRSCCCEAGWHPAFTGKSMFMAPMTRPAVAGGIHPIEGSALPLTRFWLGSSALQGPKKRYAIPQRLLRC